MKKDLSQIVAKFLWETGAIKVSVDEPFKMTSGKYSPFYIDCRVLISFPFQRDVITAYAQWLLTENKVEADFIAGGETAGIPFAAWLAEKMNKPFIYVRKKPKGHGLSSQLEGRIPPGNSVLLYEDLITDGKSKTSFIDGIRKAECIVQHCLVVMDRQEGGERTLSEAKVKLHSLLTLDECLNVGLSNHYLSPMEMKAITTYIDNVQGVET